MLVNPKLPATGTRPNRNSYHLTALTNEHKEILIEAIRNSYSKVRYYSTVNITKGQYSYLKSEYVVLLAANKVENFTTTQSV